MTLRYPLLVALAVVVCAALAVAYRLLQRERTRVLAAAGLDRAGPGRFRRHVPPALFLVALALLLVGLARPQATIGVPRVSGTVILAVDVSNSMTATDVAPSRLAAAQAAATDFVKAQPDTVDIGVVAFDQGALTTHKPSNDHDQAIAAIQGLHPAGGTSLGQAILAALTTITGRTVTCPTPTPTGPRPTWATGDPRRSWSSPTARTPAAPTHWPRPGWPPTRGCTWTPSGSGPRRAPRSPSTASRWRPRWTRTC